MSNIDSNTLADAIRNFVRQQNGSVSFVELSRQLPGIDGDFGLFPDGDSNVCFWPCLSQHAAATISALLSAGEIHVKPTAILVYLVDGGPQMPIAKSVRHYSKPHWQPVTLHPGPPPVPRKSKRYNPSQIADNAERTLQSDLRAQFEPMGLCPTGFIDNTKECAKSWNGYVEPVAAQHLAEQVERATEWLKLCGQAKAINRDATSYGLKHEAQRWCRAQGYPDGGYISNGALLMAAYGLGFRIKRPTDMSPNFPNAWINISRAPAASSERGMSLTDTAGQIAAADPEMPSGVHSREADNWRPLFAIAEMAGGEWPTRVRIAATQAAASSETASLIEVLLGDIREIFAKRAANEVEPEDRMPSGDLVAALVGIEGRPWAELGKARKPLTQNRLARLLKPLAIVPDSVRIDEKRTPKGYYLHRFKEAFARYLGLEGASEPQHRNNPDETGTSDLFQSATTETDVAVRKHEKPANDGPCCSVADQKGDSGRAPCAECGLPGGNEIFFSDGPMVRLHRECEMPYRRALDEGHAPNGETEKPADDTGAV